MIYKLLPSVPRGVGRRLARCPLSPRCCSRSGKYLIGLYLGKSRGHIGIRRGQGGMVVLLLVWVFYSAQIFLFGAEFTWVYAPGPHGSHASAVTPSLRFRSSFSDPYAGIGCGPTSKIRRSRQRPAVSSC